MTRQKFKVLWICPNEECLTLNADDYVQTTFPMCGECSKTYFWDDLLTDEQIRLGNERLRAFVLDDIDVTRAPTDGTIVVQVDTPELPEDQQGPVFRIYLNDGVIYENPPYPGEVKND